MGIGSGSDGSSCGNITIASTVTSVLAISGNGGVSNSGSDIDIGIGASKGSSCGTVTIEPGANVTLDIGSYF